MAYQPLRWGISSAGRIAHDFVTALATDGLPAYRKNVPYAVAARSAEKAKKFAEAHGIPRSYGSYEELAKDAEIDIVYIASVTPEHYAHTKLMLEHNKHVLCEKSLTTNFKHTDELLNLAKEKKLFLMEAVWTRFFPAMYKLKELLDSGAIGEVLLVTASMRLPSADVGRTSKPEFGGGCILNLLIYCIQIAQFVYGSEPKEVIGRGGLLPTGAEESCIAILEYEGSRFAEISIHSRIRQKSEAVIYGTKGMIEVCDPFHAPTKLVHCGEVMEFPLPTPSASPAGFEFENSAGLSYEAEAVRQCLIKGKTECQEVTPDETRVFARIMDELIAQVGSRVEPESTK